MGIVHTYAHFADLRVKIGKSWIKKCISYATQLKYIAGFSSPEDDVVGTSKFIDVRTD